MAIQLQTEIERLKRHILSLAATVEENVALAVRSVQDRNPALAREVIQTDLQVDQMEVNIEEECLKILALNQPVAVDLRFIVAVLKLNNDLERIGDLAVNIAERTAFLATQDKIDIPLDFPTMFEKAQAMFRNSLDALINMDSALARHVCAADDEVDDLNRQIFVQIKAAILTHPEWVDSLISLLSISRLLERIADHATNISEDVIYLVEGVIIRHKTEYFHSLAEEEAAKK